jgi:hypothetical protein
MSAPGECLEVGDQVRIRDSAIRAIGIIVAGLMSDYVAVRWNDMRAITAHRRRDLERLAAACTGASGLASPSA